jgi:hypothetical protein
MVGVPMQRDEKLGTRNFLTEEELKAREAQFARQEEQDNADFSLENALGHRAATWADPSRRRRTGSSAATRSIRRR